MVKKLFQDDRLVIFDGATGTSLQELGWSTGQPADVCNMVKPELVEYLNKSYADAGADVITSNTFGSNTFKLKPFGYTPEEVIKKAVSIARRAAGTRPVALSVGPLGKLLGPMGDMTFDDAYSEFAVQMKAGQEAGVDLILIQTMTDLYEAKAAVIAARENTNLPVICTMTFQKNGRTMMGNDPESVLTVLEALGVDALGVNCSLGPDDLMPIVKIFTENARVPVLVQPNAGLPELKDGKAVYALTPEYFAEAAEKIADMGAKLIGGCCGTNPSFTKALSSRLGGRKWKKRDVPAATKIASCRQTIILDKEFHTVGQRINPGGRPDLTRAVKEMDLNLFFEEAMLQKQSGAEILDINVFVENTDEAETMYKTVEFIQSMLPVPMVIDSAAPRALEAGAKAYNGKPVLSSVNGSNDSLEKVLPIVKKYGTAVIGRTVDEAGIPDTAEGRLKIAEKILEAALAYGIKREDLIIDCIVESEASVPGRDEITLEALRLIKKELGLKTILGISSISYGSSNRERLNAEFLKKALEAGLDLAVLDPMEQETADVISELK